MREHKMIDEMIKDMNTEFGFDNNQIENALDVIHYIGVGQDLSWRKGEGIIKSDISINKDLWNYLKQGYILEGKSLYRFYPIFLLDKGGEEIFQELLELKANIGNVEKFKNEFNIVAKIFEILYMPPGFGRNIDKLMVKEKYEILFLNSKKGNELKNFLNNQMNLFHSILKKYNLYIELTTFNSTGIYSKHKFINNEDVYEFLLESIESFPESFNDNIIELNRKVSFFDNLINSIDNPRIRENIIEDYSIYLECRDLIDEINKEEKITTSFSSNPPHFKLIKEQKFKNKMLRLRQDYIDRISDPIIDYLLNSS